MSPFENSPPDFTTLSPFDKNFPDIAIALCLLLGEFAPESWLRSTLLTYQDSIVSGA